MKNSRSVIMGAVTFVGLIVLRQQCYAGEDGVSSEGAAAIDWMSEMQKGGATGIALIILAVAGVLFAIERFINMRRSNILGSSDVVNQAVNMGSESNVEAAQALYEKSPSSFTKVVNHMAEHSDYDPAEIMETASDLAGRDIESHRRRVYSLGVVSTLAPLLGLLGTMIGMIEAFAKFSKLTDSSEAALVLGDSIGKALITTAIGLIIAIPSLAAFHYFKVRLGSLSDKLEAELDRVHRTWFSKKVR
jgi:biopolymer transport protein ExbB